jgi:hypothetical protein
MNDGVAPTCSYMIDLPADHRNGLLRTCLHPH